MHRSLGDNMLRDIDRRHRHAQAGLGVERQVLRKRRREHQKGRLDARGTECLGLPHGCHREPLHPFVY